MWVSPIDKVANISDCDIIVSEFNLQSHYCVHFWTETLGKGMNLLIPAPSYNYSSTKMALVLNNS